MPEKISSKNNPNEDPETSGAGDAQQNEADAVETQLDREEEEELEQLKAEVEQMAEKLLQLRKTVPSLLREKLESLFVAMRPPNLQSFPAVSTSEKSSFSLPESMKDFQTDGLLAGTEEEEEEEDREMAELIETIKVKLAANVASMPLLLDKMKSCIQKINMLDEYKGIDAIRNGVFGHRVN